VETLAEVTNILITGVGGQGNLLASRIIGQLALNSGLDVKISEVHGMAQRGGSVITYVKIGEKIYSPLIEKGAADYLIAFEMLEALRWSDYLKNNGIMIVNEQMILPMPVICGEEEYPANIKEEIKTRSRNVFFVKALDAARHYGNIKTVNTVLLGVLAKLSAYSLENWLEALAGSIPAKLAEVNKKAFMHGYNLKF
jgi:indolepyruvate ferredoxin oxidoreductase, beta subunit